MYQPGQLEPPRLLMPSTVQKSEAAAALLFVQARSLSPPLFARVLCRCYSPRRGGCRFSLRGNAARESNCFTPGTLACPLLSVPLSCFFMQSLSVSSSGLAVLPNGSNVSVSDLNLCSQLHAQATSERSNRVSARRRHRPLLPRRRSAPRSSPVAAIAVIA
jgi:hypothetical protein